MPKVQFTAFANLIQRALNHEFLHPSVLKRLYGLYGWMNLWRIISSLLSFDYFPKPSIGWLKKLGLRAIINMDDPSRDNITHKVL